MVILYLFFNFSYSLTGSLYLTGAILRGNPVAEKAHPYIAQIRSVDNYISQGTILDPFTVITEADTCIFSKKVYGGKVKSFESEWEEQVRDVGNAKEAWCFLHLSEPFIFDEYVSAISLAPVGSKPKGGNCSVFGWGRTEPDNERTGKSEYSDVLQGPCGEDHGAPGICDGLLYSVTTITYHNCTRPAMASIPAMPRDWYEKVLADAVLKCNQNETSYQTRIGPGTTAKPKLTTVTPGPGPGPGPGPNITTTTTSTTTTEKVPVITTTTTKRTTTTRKPGESCCQDFTSRPNGNPVKPHSRPYIVQIHSKQGEISVGVLIDAYTVVTSPRNVHNVDKVIAGKHYFGRQKKRSKAAFIATSPNIPIITTQIMHTATGEVPSNACFMIGWQGTSADTELREQPVTFEDPSHCEDAHPTVSCVEGGACLHDLGSPVVCAEGSTNFFHSIVASKSAYCEHGVLTSIPEIPLDWFSVQIKKAEIICRSCPSSCRNP
ncbi:unnamed protein product [Allacma fusca]|uniref:Peptidase S1 domain-containing protein n=1 Tax=Allacma fusca TaxID=39272 RepID=A0A8J2LLF8_9HEXA|nr:unnamed protein product [Allacma fusca]